MTKIISFLFITFLISFPFLIIYELNKSKNKKTNNQYSWDDSYQKAQEFISKLRSEKIDLLYGKKNIWLAWIKVQKSEHYRYCEGQIDPLKNDKVDFVYKMAHQELDIQMEVVYHGNQI